MHCRLTNDNLKGLSERDDVVLAQYTAGPDYDLIADELREVDRFVRDQWGVDTLVSVGTSAGASSALVAALRDGCDKLVLFYPQVDFTKHDPRLHVMVKAAEKLGWNPADRLDELKDVKVFHGTKDPLVSVENAKLFPDPVLVDAGHGFPISEYL
jgi:dienelactone hydrolase